jgi:hypothetical protein
MNALHSCYGLCVLLVPCAWGWLRRCVLRPAEQISTGASHCVYGTRMEVRGSGVHWSLDLGGYAGSPYK